jgi:Catechol dioxygenase N terminus
MAVIVRKLHEAVKEIEPTQEEWFASIKFLTETGQICNEWRQEYILLSDILASRYWSTRSTTASLRALRNRRCWGHSIWPMRLNYQWARTPASTRRASRCLSMAASSTPRAIRSRAPRSMSDRPMTRAFMMCSRRACSPTSTCAAYSARERMGDIASAASNQDIIPSR